MATPHFGTTTSLEASQVNQRSDTTIGTAFACETCDGVTRNPENEYGEHICDGCLDNAAERAWERHCEAFHDGGAVQFRSLQDQQIEARRFK